MPETGSVGRFAERGSRGGVRWLTSLGLCLALGPSGCSDPRISLQEFLAMQEEAAEVSTSQPTGSVDASWVDRILVPYRVGPDDVLNIALTGPDATPILPAPFYVRVDRGGQIELPMVGGVHVADRELQDVEQAIGDAYVPKVLREVVVHVEVFAIDDTTNVLVRGAVTAPGLVKLRRTERNLLYALLGAGGMSEASSGRATLRRIRNPADVVTLDVTDPIQLEAALSLAPLEQGDIITVLAAQPNTLYVGGLVNRPAPQLYSPGVEVTVLQAIAAASGLRTDVTPTEATLIRRLSNGEDVHVKIDINRVAQAKDPNIALAAGDILWVPETLGTRVQDWVNRNVFIRAGASLNYNITGVEYLNRASQQSGSSSGDVQNQYDPFGFLNRNAALQNLTARPVVTTP